MTPENLRELLTQLHARLNDASTLDAEARQQLTTVAQDIEKALGRSDASAAAPTKPRLEALAVKFEAEHPAVAETLRELLDTLGKAGI
ncbi:MAG TPA: DUF4404 family protein [Steroidobacteraceae bacterium]|jgi:hypothetical protein|nr:DUF4404 family protein [Steroidobacteraceae bacterium]